MVSGNKLIYQLSNHLSRCTLLNRKTHTAWSAASIRSTRSPSTRRARIPPLLRANAATIPSKKVSVVRPNPCSERRQRQPRRLPSSLSATLARSADARSLVDANHSFLERKKTPRDRFFSEQSVSTWSSQMTPSQARTRTHAAAIDFSETSVA